MSLFFIPTSLYSFLSHHYMAYSSEQSRRRKRESLKSNFTKSNLWLYAHNGGSDAYSCKVAYTIKAKPALDQLPWPGGQGRSRQSNQRAAI
mmetsp:Transcript_673/g.1555  ORF Transcript_673/g.1555 Transcript_673/m.1555 type:complete len:91 (+) Transcript_673:140-412(+)